MSKEKEPSKRAYELAEERRFVKSKTPDELDEVLDEEDKELAKEARRLRLAEIVAQRKLRVKEIEDKLGEKPAGANPQMDNLVSALLTNPDAQKQWLALSPEERAVIVQSLSAMTSRGGDANLMLPLMLSTMRGGGGQMTADSVAKLFEAGVNAARQSQPQNPNAQFEMAKNLVEPWYKLLGDQQNQIWAERLKYLEEKIVDPVDYMKQFGQTAESFGYRRGDVTPELWRMNLDMEDRWRTIQTQQAQTRWEAERSDKRTDSILSYFGPAVAALLGQLGAAGAARVAPQGAGFQRSIPVKCPICGFEPIFLPRENPQGYCPSCGQMLGLSPQAQTPVQPLPTQAPPTMPSMPNVIPLYPQKKEEPKPEEEKPPEEEKRPPEKTRI